MFWSGAGRAFADSRLARPGGMAGDGRSAEGACINCVSLVPGAAERRVESICHHSERLTHRRVLFLHVAHVYVF